MDLNCLLVAPKTFIPVLFGHASDDKLIRPHHSDLISESYAGDKNIIKFDGDHNSSRPQFFYDSVSIFFYNVLRPPQISTAHKLEKYYDLGNLKLGSGVDQNLLYEILSSLRSATTDASSSSSALPSILTTKSVSELISEAAPAMTDTESIFREDTAHANDDPADVQDKLNGQTEDCCSDRESWGRCSSLGGSDEESYADHKLSRNSIEVLATPMPNMKEKVSEQKEEKKPKKNKKKKKKKKKKDETVEKKGKGDNMFEKLDALSRRLRLCLQMGSIHGRHKSS